MSKIPDIPYHNGDLERKINEYFENVPRKEWGLYSLASYLEIDGDVLKAYFMPDKQPSGENKPQENMKIRTIKKARTRIIAELETHTDVKSIFQLKQPHYAGYSDVKQTGVNLSEIKISFGKVGDKGFD